MFKLTLIAAALAALSSTLVPVGDFNVAFADKGRETFSISFHYDASASVQTNYAAFVREAKRACMANDGLKPLAQQVADRACVADVMDKLVARMQRADLSALHADRTGRTAPSRSFAAR